MAPARRTILPAEQEASVMNKDDFDGILAGVEQAIAYARGEADPSTYRVHVPEQVDVKAIRAKTHLTQDQFAAHFGFSTGAVRDWEQRRKTPDTVARVLLTVLDKEPDAVRRALDIPFKVVKAKLRKDAAEQRMIARKAAASRKVGKAAQRA